MNLNKILRTTLLVIAVVAFAESLVMTYFAVKGTIALNYWKNLMGTRGVPIEALEIMADTILRHIVIAFGTFVLGVVMCVLSSRSRKVSLPYSL